MFQLMSALRVTNAEDEVCLFSLLTTENAIVAPDSGLLNMTYRK
jgi:hypothetical protein